MPGSSNLTRSFQHYLQEISLNGLGIWPLLCYENQIPKSFSDTRLVPNIININIWFPRQVPSQSYGQMEAAKTALDTILS